MLILLLKILLRSVNIPLLVEAKPLKTEIPIELHSNAKVRIYFFSCKRQKGGKVRIFTSICVRVTRQFSLDLTDQSLRGLSHPLMVQVQLGLKSQLVRKLESIQGTSKALHNYMAE